MKVRAKLRCFAVERLDGGSSKAADIRFIADYSDDPVNKSWAQATPSGEVRLFVTNPDAIDQFVPGKYYYVDFERVEGSEG